ncbi:Transmembrane protein [Phytophthora cinnamomi]|uniref:Transmembrane protein n=1 Tax=Phytophthora cinnamomi TaxID=4785 RepID=UPI0035596601|nr:Transmembrane protein [Phytophthora cinnamomi]
MAKAEIKELNRNWGDHGDTRSSRNVHRLLHRQASLPLVKLQAAAAWALARWPSLTPSTARGSSWALS